MHIFTNPNYNFLRWRWHAVALSWVLILAGLFVIYTRGLPKGIEFAGGTSVIMQFDQAPSVEVVRDALNKNYPGGGQDAVVQSYGDPSLRQVMVRVPQVGAEQGASLSARAQAIEQALQKAGLKPTVVGTEIVGPSVGEELTQKGISAFVLSLIGILAYIAFRFEFSFAVGAVIATLHDVLVTFAFLAFFRYDLSLNVIAALLTVTGYSTNDTIVIFDRVRENMRKMRRDSLSEIINISINQTLGRTVITAGTALLSALALFFFGGEVLHGFAFTMIVGIVTGTYSSVFVAAAIVTFWRRTKPSKLSTAATAAAAPAASTPRKSKAQRKARAS
ncbi:MAG TPA: protein translocase subunit SecF [Vicinamibacterales bacterium]|nr:protein translocase subunit SecF [Vicinamibacterales bacterium]